MTKQIAGMLAIVLLSGLAGREVAAVEVKSRAQEVKITGRVHTQFNTSSVGGELGSEFLIRRARLSAELKMSDFVGGKVQPDFGSGKLVLKDAYMKLHFSPNLVLRLGQFKRPFDLFELTSSTRILVVERAGKIRGISGDADVDSLNVFDSFSYLTERLSYSDRDIGVEALLQNTSKTISGTVAITNGTGAHKVPHKTSPAIGEKQYTGRLKVEPWKERDLAVAIGATARPHPESEVEPDLSVKYASAVEADLECGDFDGGHHVQAGAVWGENWRKNPEDPPSFLAAQVIGTYKIPVGDNSYVEAVEPLLRVSYADPDDDAGDDSGILITPGVQVFFVGRNKIAVNVDVFLPESDDFDTEYSVKAQSSVHF